MHALDELAHLVLRVSVIEAHHRDEVLRGLEFAQRPSADALAGRIGRSELRELFFQVEQLAVEPVIIKVRDEGFGLDVVGVVVFADFLDQFGVTGFGLSECHQAGVTRDLGKWKSAVSVAFSSA